jgi:glycosyltransferase involved in cell wall biosynthesis
MVAYTEYVRDPRVRRYGEALVRHGYEVDCFVLKEAGKPDFESVNGVSLFHLNIHQYRGSSNVAYIISYLKFFLLATAAFIKNLYKNYAVIHVHNMPDFLVFTALFNKLSGSKIILDIHDTMPELYLAKFKSIIGKLVYGILLFQEKCASYIADKVITVHEPHLEHIAIHHGIKRHKFVVIPNFADKNLFRKTGSGLPTQENNDFKLIYHGTIAERFGLDVVLEGIKKLKQLNHTVKLDIYGKGDGVPELNHWITELNLSDRVFYHGQIPLDDIPQKISEADLGIVSYIHSEATHLMLPLKLMEYIAMGIPSLTVKNKPISYYFKSDELAYYKNNDSDSFSNQLIKLIKSPQELIRLRTKTEDINQRLNWENEQMKYIHLIKELSGNPISC